KTKVALIKEFDKVLSLDLIDKALKLCENDGGEEEIPADIMELVEKRKQARAEKNFALADMLRDEIAGMGYVIEETRQGTKIRKK
ncbi:MAG: cysteine--tRNA ligase, partial [Oscillospiraceae bacterium]|nr:cysteine--tRNA ligase [Oscillospiraceae bacterium]